MASYTQRLNLLKKDPVADGADTFNIETMLNENWEKIDKGAALLDENGKIPEEQLPEMDYDPAGAASAVQQELEQHMVDPSAHQDIRQAMLTAAVQVTYNGGES